MLPARCQTASPGRIGKDRTRLQTRFGACQRSIPLGDGVHDPRSARSESRGRGAFPARLGLGGSGLLWIGTANGLRAVSPFPVPGQECRRYLESATDERRRDMKDQKSIQWFVLP